MTDMVIPPAREAVVAAIRYELDAIEARDYYGQVLPQEDSEVIADAVLALLPTKADTKALVETATRLGRELGRREAAEEIAAALEAVPAEVYPEDFFPVDGTSVDCQSARVMRFAYPAAAHIAREIATREPTP